MIAQYDMAFRLSTFDYFNWLTHVKLLGATEIVFKIDKMRSTKWPLAECKLRFDNYIAPGTALARLPHRIGSDGDPKIGSHQLPAFYADVLRLGQPGGFERLLTVDPPAREKYTVTIRETFHNKFKNSDRPLWLRFAERIGARVIEDTSRVPIGLYERVALYAGATMNFGVVNGPLAMLYYTPYPFHISCDPQFVQKSFGGHGIFPGDQIPFALPHQRLSWGKVTLDGLMSEARAIKGAA